MIRIGVLGAAQVAHYAMIEPVRRRDDCIVAALACRDWERGRSFCKEHGIDHLETDYDALINRPDVDVIYNALPPSRHADLTMRALKTGKPVLCEKPFAMNAEEAKQMVDVSNSTRTPLIEAFHYRFHPAFHRAQNIIDNGDIGDVLHIDAVFAAPVPFKEGEIRHTFALGGGSLMDMWCYPVHWMRSIMKALPEIVSATCVQSQPQIDLTTTAVCSFSQNRTARIECSMDVERPFRAELTVLGSRGVLSFKNPLTPHSDHLISVEAGGVRNTETVNSALSTYDFQLAHWLDVIRDGATPIGGGSDSIENMQVIDAIYQKAGLSVRLAEGMCATTTGT